MPWTNASIVLNSRDATGGNGYNRLLFNAKNQNIIQGQIESISVAEVNFPYDIPNVQAGDISGLNIYNTFSLDINGYVIPGFPMDVVVPPGFYTGTELAAAINTQITTLGAALPTPLTSGQLPTVSYSVSDNLFVFLAPVTPLNPQYNGWFLLSPYTFPVGAPNARTNLGRDLLSIMGFLRSQSPQFSTTLPLVSGQSAPLTFTQYIDICSPELCKFQYFRDGSTTNLARRSDVICRLFIANNIAVQEPEGTRSFVINRQFFNARVMRWTADNAVGNIDINLYDDAGQPLLTAWLPRPYQITFNCYETPKEDPQKY